MKTCIWASTSELGPGDCFDTLTWERKRKRERNGWMWVHKTLSSVDALGEFKIGWRTEISWRPVVSDYTEKCWFHISEST